MDAIGSGLNAHLAEADSMRIQFCTVWTGLESVAAVVILVKTGGKYIYIESRIR